MKKTLLALLVMLAANAPSVHGNADTIQKLDLGQAISRAEQNHPALKQARALAEAAAGRLEQSGRLPNPEAVVRAEAVRPGGRATGDADYLAGVSQTVPLGGRLSAERNSAEQGLKKEQALVEARRWEIRQRVHAAFATALYQQQAYANQQKRQQIEAKAVNIAQARVAAGEAVPGEVAQAEMEQARTAAEVIRAETLLRQSRLALATAIGEPALAIHSLEGSLDATLELPSLENLLQKMASHPAILAANADLAAHEAGIRLAEAQRIPDVKVEVLYRRIESEKRNAVDFGFSIPLPIFDRGQGRVKEARAESDASRAIIQQQQAGLSGSIRESYGEAAAALGRSKAFEKDILPRARAVWEAAEARFSAGDISLGDLLPVRRAWTDTQMAHLESLREAMISWAHLKSYLPAN